jgi:hypothetical protein
MRSSVIFLVAATMAAPACSSSVGRGTTLYEQRSYIEAAEVFERTQNRLVAMDAVDRARYGLYRGLTLMALGDLRGAERWVDYAEAQERAQPGLLSQDERAALTHNRSDLAERRQATLSKPQRDWTQGVARTSSTSADQDLAR